MATAAAKQRDLISIVIPAYNHERFVAQAIRSVLEQSDASLELIVVDDGSTDGTAAAAEKAFQGDPRARLLRQKNSGAHAAMNRGAAEGSGEFITFLNSDDVFYAGRLRALLAASRRQPEAQVFFSLLEVITESGRPASGRDSTAFWYHRTVSLRHYFPTLSFSLLTNNLAVTTGNLFVRRAHFDKLGGYREQRWTHDLDFLLRSFPCAEPQLVPEVLMGYRVHETNTIRSWRSPAFYVEARRVLEDYFEGAMRACLLKARVGNPIMPALGQWPQHFHQFLRENRPFCGDGTFFDHVSLLNLEAFTAKRLPEFIRDFFGASPLEARTLLRANQSIRSRDVRSSYEREEVPRAFWRAEVEDGKYWQGLGTLLKVKVLFEGVPSDDADTERMRNERARCDRAVLVAFNGEKLVGTGRRVAGVIDSRLGPVTADYLFFVENQEYECHSELSWRWEWLEIKGDRSFTLLSRERSQVSARRDPKLELEWHAFDQIVPRAIVIDGQRRLVSHPKNEGCLYHVEARGQALYLTGWESRPRAIGRPATLAVICDNEVVPVRQRRYTGKNMAEVDSAFELVVDEQWLAQKLKALEVTSPTAFQVFILPAEEESGPAVFLGRFDAVWDGYLPKVSVGMGRRLLPGSWLLAKKELEYTGAKGLRSWTVLPTPLSLRAPKTLFGCVEEMGLEKQGLRIRGWSIDPDDREAPEAIVISAEGGAASLLTLFERDDIASLHSLAGPAQVGFDGLIRVSGKLDPEHVAVHALFRSGKAVRLPLHSDLTDVDS